MLENIRQIIKQTLTTYWRISKQPLPHREFIPFLINSLKLKGLGIEVGTAEGLFSDTILKYSNLSRLYSVDPYQYIDPNIYEDAINDSQAGHNQRYSAAATRLQKYLSRSVIIKQTSEKAAGLFSNNSLDFVYIDANHSYKFCKEDLRLWWPKIKKNGLFAGHDYLNGTFHKTLFGVKQAVDEFFLDNNQRLYITPEICPNWYVIKS